MYNLFISWIIFFFGIFQLNAQKFDYATNTYHIKQNDKSLVFSISEKKIPNHLDHEKKYFWVKSQKVIATYGGASGQLLDGLFESFYPNNNLYEKGSFKHGLKDGKWFQWEASGELISIENWNNGQLSGKQIYFNGGNKIDYYKTIKFRFTKTVYVDSVIKTSNIHYKKIEYSKNGRRISVSRKKHNLLHGVQWFLFEGKKVKSTYKNGIQKENANNANGNNELPNNVTTEKKWLKEIRKQKDTKKEKEVKKSGLEKNNEKTQN